MFSLLCFVAHPDDETIFCGGTLALLASHGAAVHVVCLTRGEGGELGQPPITDREHLGGAREQEMVSAVGQLGGKSLTFLGYTDPTVGPNDALFAPEHDPVMLAGQITAAVKQFKADAVLTHGSNGEYGHPAHKLMHQMTLAAVAALRQEAPNHLTTQPPDYLTTRLPDHPTAIARPPGYSTTRPLDFYTFSASFPDHPRPRLANADDPADIILDVSTVLDKKESAALCHKTQNALFVRRRSQELGRPVAVREALLTVESLHRVFGSPDDELSRMLGAE